MTEARSSRRFWGQSDIRGRVQFRTETADQVENSESSFAPDARACASKEDPMGWTCSVLAGR
jgi:hypothetical protein